MPVDKRKQPIASRWAAAAFSMSLPLHLLYGLFILICLSWNAFNTYQYRLLLERQWQLENLLTVSPLPLTPPEQPSLKQWLADTIHSISSNSIPADNRSAQVRIRRSRVSLFVLPPLANAPCVARALLKIASLALSLLLMNIESNGSSRSFTSFGKSTTIRLYSHYFG